VCGGKLFGPHEENGLYIILFILFIFFNVKTHKVFCDGRVGIEYTVCIYDKSHYICGKSPYENVFQTHKPLLFASMADVTDRA